MLQNRVTVDARHEASPGSGNSSDWVRRPLHLREQQSPVAGRRSPVAGRCSAVVAGEGAAQSQQGFELGGRDGGGEHVALGNVDAKIA